MKKVPKTEVLYIRKTWPCITADSLYKYRRIVSIHVDEELKAYQNDLIGKYLDAEKTRMENSRLQTYQIEKLPRSYQQENDRKNLEIF